jgi:hypothetical protein
LFWTFQVNGGWRARVLETGRTSGFDLPTEEAALEEMKEWVERNPNDRLTEPWPHH